MEIPTAANPPAGRRAALLLALATGCRVACAEGSVTMYGLLDAGIDRTWKGQGNVQGTVFGMQGDATLPDGRAAPRMHSTRMTPSLSAQSHLGLKGMEDLGGGYRAGFTLEGGVQPDSGMQANDARLFGRQAYVSLTTPFGEARLGRQASPMLIGYYLATTGRLGSTDLMGAGLALNTLQTYQDNTVSFLVRRQDWLGALAHSFNAGVSGRISAARAAAAGPLPAASDTSGQIIGGLTAGAETADRRGNAQGALLAYTGAPLSFVATFHRNAFRGAQVGLAPRAGGSAFVPLYSLDRFRSAMIGGGIRFANGITIMANHHWCRFEDASPADPALRTASIGASHESGPLVLTGQIMRSRFANFTRGRNTGLMLGADYRFSGRTALYTRVGTVDDDRGEIVRGSVTPLPIAGGPGTLLVPLGAQEVPLFAGAGQNMGARTSIVAFGVRHQF